MKAPDLVTMHVLDKSFYLHDDVVDVSRQLLGKVLVSNIDGAITRAVITETEAYDGPTDRASHAWNNRRTARTEPLFADGGIAYVYLCYGIHHLFNVVSNVAGRPHANLVRAGRCVEGLETMLERRGADKEKVLMNGPGTFGQAMGITTALSGESLLGKRLWIEDYGIGPAEEHIEIGPRIGIDYAGEDVSKPYRFVLNRVGIGEWFDRYRHVRLDPAG